MLALRKRRMAAAPPFLRGGFRPFFFGAGLWAVIAIGLWLCVLAGAFDLPTRFDSVAWHRHEMLFGFIGAAVAGFLLTAIPNWTGRLPIAGGPLLCLFGLWAAARVAVLVSGLTGLWLAEILDVGLFVSLAALAAREVIASKNRNMPVVALVLLFGLADAADYAEAAGAISGGLGWRGAIALLVVMISMIGGRIIPSFTRNWMVKKEHQARSRRSRRALDVLVIAATALSLLFWLAFPDNRLTGLMLILAAAAQTSTALPLGRLSDMARPLGTDPSPRLRMGAARASLARPLGCRSRHSAQCRRSRANRRRNDDHGSRGDEPSQPRPHRGASCKRRPSRSRRTSV